MSCTGFRGCVGYIELQVSGVFGPQKLVLLYELSKTPIRSPSSTLTMSSPSCTMAFGLNHSVGGGDRGASPGGHAGGGGREGGGGGKLGGRKTSFDTLSSEEYRGHR